MRPPLDLGLGHPALERLAERRILLLELLELGEALLDLLLHRRRQVRAPAGTARPCRARRPPPGTLRLRRQHQPQPLGEPVGERDYGASLLNAQILGTRDS